ncbi:efflux RND transporter periplasmic adaptor subunit [Brucella haematophila]|uniref:efflux RND transporter periplasmic adaptor subunit n=1 Tax=Brucella haematophila TaxID=419474 RepID=UPI001F19DFD8|nr:efflux RND transporter periplasmic adaptor subunit [Brucella haematophila]
MQRSTIGTVVAVASTAVNSPEPGNVAILNVKDGAIVKKGDLIAQLDDRAIRATVVKDQASVAKSQATLNNAQILLKRMQDLVTKGVSTSQAGDDALAALKVAEAQLQVDQAQLAADQVTLDNTKIIAPFDGQLGVVLVSVGAYLSAGSPVATITQMKPIYADFTLPETDIALIRETLATGALKATASAVSADGRDISESGPVGFLDNTIDAASGTVRLRATLDNQSGNFWPGQSLRVLVEAGQADNLVLVPSVAVQPQENGSISYVVKTDNSIEVRPVTVALRANGMAGLSAGLQPGEKVVTEGQASLANGSKVKLSSNDAETKVSSN